MTDIHDNRPTWQLVLDASIALRRSGSQVFQLAEIIRGVQILDGTRERESIQPVIQGMTINAGKGPAQSCGKVFRRVAHGQYELLSSIPLSRTEDWTVATSHKA